MDEWIHVDDRLPDTEDVMFVFVQKLDYKNIDGVDVAWLSEGKEWLDPDSFLDLESSEEGDRRVVTHWRPYVTPPHPTTGILDRD